ncbi:MAG: hypothetical protein IPJ77_02920 [Planctomycetes bacterium]|nr:hypothetical protein [Planctomycetota bacterium]
MLRFTKTTLFGALALSFLSALPVDAQTVVDGPQGRRPAPGQRRRRPHRRPPQELRQLLQSLQITQEQKNLVRAEAQAVAPRVREARDEAWVRVQAERARPAPDREALRAELRELKHATLEQLLPHARRVVQSLTNEQRALLAAKAAEHGRTFDENRLAERRARPRAPAPPRAHRPRAR